MSNSMAVNSAATAAVTANAIFWVTTFPCVCRGQHIQWIHPDPTLHYLKMQVVAGAVTSAAHIYGLHRTKLLSFMTRPSKI